MEQVKLGIIGAGWAAGQHLSVINAIDGLEVVGITSRTKSKAEELASTHRISQCFDGVDSLIRDASPDALLILVSEDQMFDVVSYVIPKGLPLLIEKPAGLTPEVNEKLAQLAKEYNVKTMVGYNRRYYSIFHKGLEIIQKNGSLLGVAVEGHERMWRVREGGHFPDEVLDQWIYANSTHTIDLIRFFGGDISEIFSVTKNLKEKRADQMSAVMKLESGAIGNYCAHWYSPGGWRVVLYGEGVTVEFKPLEQGTWTDKNFKSHAIEPDEVDTKFKAGFYKQMEAFQGLVQEGLADWPMLDLEGACKTMQLAQQISKVEEALNLG